MGVAVWSAARSGARPSLAGALDVLLAALPSSLVPPGEHAGLLAAARALPPVARGGLELRLGPAAGPVDLHQSLSAARAEAGLLADYALCGGAHPAWADLARLARWWAVAAPQDVPTVWVEVDRPAPGHAPAPSVFVTLAGADRAWQVREVLAVLGRSPRAGLQRCLAACGDAVDVSHVGLMLPRPDAPTRLNVRAPDGDALRALLAAVGWAGDVRRAEAWGRRLGRHAETLVACLDLADDVAPMLGFEVFVPGEGAARSWHGLLDELEAGGLCTAADRDALGAVPAVLVPGAGGRPWPDELTAAALLCPDDAVGVLGVWVHHLKVVVRPGGAEAKAYLRFQHDLVPVPATPPRGRAGTAAGLSRRRPSGAPASAGPSRTGTPRGGRPP